MAAAPCATKLSLKGLLLRAMTAAATPASEGRGADHGRPAIGARSARRNDTPIRWRFLVIQEHHESFDRPLRGCCPYGLFVRPRGLRCRRREPESARPVSGNLYAVKRVSGLRGATCCWAAGLAFIVMAVNALPAFAGSEGRTSGWAGTYAAAFAGAGRLGNRIVDVDGFADWGNPGSKTGYSGAGAVGGLLVGKRFGIGGVRFRVEADAMFGDLSAGTNRLDPGCTDEAAASRFRWISTVRVGVEETIGDVDVFMSGGPALARIVNSVTDTDYSGSTCLEAGSAPGRRRLVSPRFDGSRMGDRRRFRAAAGRALGAPVRRFVSGLRQRGLSREPVRQQFMRARRRYGALPLHRQEQAGRRSPGDRLSVRRIGNAGAGGCGAVHGAQICLE